MTNDQHYLEAVVKAAAFARRSKHDCARDADHYWQHLAPETREVELAAARAAISVPRPTAKAGELANELRELGEHPSRAHLPMGETLRSGAEALTTQVAEIERLTAELARRERNELRNCINWGPCSEHDGLMSEEPPK